MISKELKKLNRRELVDVIYQLKKNEEQMQEQIASLEAELQDRRIHLSVAGSIAEAYYGIPKDIENKAISYLTKDLQTICFAFKSIKKERINHPNND